MKTFVLDFTGLENKYQLHDYLRETLSLPDYYGHNLDALWDCLDRQFSEPTAFILKNTESVPPLLLRQMSGLKKLFSDLQEQNPEVTVMYE